MKSNAAARVIAGRVRARLSHEGVDLGIDGGMAARYVHEEMRRYSEQALGGAFPLVDDERAVEQDALAELVGLGPLQVLLDDPDVEEIWINSPRDVFVARNGVSARVPIELEASEVRELVERMLRPSGRRVDLSEPFVDASLLDGSRLHVAIPDVTRHWVVNVRRFRSSTRTLDQLIRAGMLSARAAAFLHIAVQAGLSILVSGSTGAGKTTLLGALLGSVPRSERIITVEETFELSLDAPDWVALQGRRPGLEGTGEVSLRRLVKEALRMRPDRIVVGEVREGESLDLLLAMNSGHAALSSIHANGAREALAKLCLLPLLAGSGVDSSFIVPTVASSVDLVVHVERDSAGRRRVREIIAATGRLDPSDASAGWVDTVQLFTERGGSLQPTGVPVPRPAKFERTGLDPAPLLAVDPLEEGR